MSQWTQADVDRIKDRKSPKAGKQSKYRNVKVMINGEKFDSKREAAYWQGLLARQACGDVRNLQRQVSFPLLCPERVTNTPALYPIVAHYIADYVFDESDRGYGGVTWTRRVVDAKGKRTQTYLLKRKWLELQDGITIEEV